MLSLKVVSKVGKPGEHRRIGTYYHLGSIEPGVTKTAHQVKHRSRVIIATGFELKDQRVVQVEFEDCIRHYCLRDIE